MGWMHAVARWPLGFMLPFIVLWSIGCSWLLVRLTRRYAPHGEYESNNEPVGHVYAVFGVLYGVLLAFTIIVAWERFAEAERNVMTETTTVSKLWRDVAAFPPGIASEIQRDLVEYASSMVADEWGELGLRGQPHPRTQGIYEHLWQEIYRLEPESKSQEAFLGEVLSDVNELSASRRLRVLHSRTGINPILWVALILGAVPTLFVPTLLSTRQSWVQVVSTSAVALCVLLNLYVALVLQYPFTGSVAIEKEPFVRLHESLQQRLTEPPPAP